MIILLWTDNLYTRTQLESASKTAGADVLVKEERERMSPDLIVMDLNAAGAMEHIRRLRAKHPATKILATAGEDKLRTIWVRVSGSEICIHMT